MSKNVRPAAVLLSLLAVLAGCGVKNDPVPPNPATAANVAQPQTGRTPPPANPEFGRLEELTAAQRDLDQLAPAEATRNPGAPERRFPLDFLLN